MPISSRRQWPPENTTVVGCSRSQPHRNRTHLVVATTSASASADRPSPTAMKRVCLFISKLFVERRTPVLRKNKNIHLIPFIMQSMPSGFVAAGSARPVSRPSPHCVCFRMLAVAMRPAAAHMDLQSLEVQAVPLAALGGVWTRGKAGPRHHWAAFPLACCASPWHRLCLVADRTVVAEPGDGPGGLVRQPAPGPRGCGEPFARSSGQQHSVPPAWRPWRPAFAGGVHSLRCAPRLQVVFWPWVRPNVL